ncbi:MAG: pilus assembly protein PilM [Opitutaceae bacterium]|nr:pilus assembly protein PilM [Opitutaceae bacterium]
MKRALVINCGGAHVSVALFAHGADGGLRVEKFARREFAGWKHDDANWHIAMASALEASLSEGVWRAPVCCVGLPGHLALTKLVRTPTVDREKRPRVAQFEASQNIPYPLVEAAWGYAEMGDDGEETELLIGAAKLETVETICRAVQAAGVLITNCEPASVALWRSTLYRTTEPTLVVKVGARSTQLVFSSHGVHLRTLALGGQSVTTAIAERLQIDIAEAEMLKRRVLSLDQSQQVDAASHEVVQTAWNEFADRLQAELQRSWLAYMRHPGAKSPTQLWWGGGGMTAELAGRLAERLGIPAAILPADPNLRFGDSGISQSDTDSVDMAVLSGLAAGALRPKSPRLELLPPSYATALQRRRSHPWWLAVAALLLLLPAPLLWQQRTLRIQQTADLAVLQAQVEPLRRIAALNADHQARIAELNNQIAVLQDAEARRTGWLSLLADLQTCFAEVGDVWLDGLEAIEVEADSANRDSEPRLELALRGRLLDAGAADTKVRQLFTSLQASPYFEAVSHERFDRSQPGLLRFEINVRIKPEATL